MKPILHPVIVFDYQVLDRSQSHRDPCSDEILQQLEERTTGSGIIMQGEPSAAREVGANIVACRSDTYRTHFATAPDIATDHADYAQAGLMANLKCSPIVVSATDALSDFTGGPYLGDANWDIVDQMMTPFCQKTGYPALYLGEVNSSPHPRVKTLSRQGNGSEDMVQPFCLPMGPQMTAHERIEFIAGLDETIAFYCALNNWQRRFDIGRPILL